MPYRDDQQIAGPNARALLIPERELTRKLRVLINSGIDLIRPINQSRSWKIIDEKVAVIVAVATTSHPADHVVLVGWRERHDLDKLILYLLARQLHQDEVRFERFALLLLIIA